MSTNRPQIEREAALQRRSLLGEFAARPIPMRARSIIEATVGGLAGHRGDAVAEWVPTLAFRYGCADIEPGPLLAVLSHERDTKRRFDVAILLHGLLIDESNWNVGNDPITFRLEAAFGWVPICVRYNTGRHISHNGEQLATLLQSLKDTWGDRLGRVQLLGHSMGGLVGRSTLAALERRGASVLDNVDRLFLFATPNNGAEIEVAGHFLEYIARSARVLPAPYVQAALRASFGVKPDSPFDPTGRILALAGYAPSRVLKGIESFIASRSDGIRDIRYGYMLREEWTAAEVDGLSLMANHRRPVPPPEGVRVYAIAGSLWPDVGSEPSRVRNDGVVTVASVAAKAGEFDDLKVVENGRFAEVPMLLHQLVPASPRVFKIVKNWVDNDL